MGSDSERDAAVSLLQFYSDRAIANASFLVASMFGLFVVLSIMSSSSVERLGETWWGLTSTYVFLWGFGFYSLLNFGHYAQVAEVAKNRIKHTIRFDPEDGRWKEINLEFEILNEARKDQVQWFSDFKRGTEPSFATRSLKTAKTVLLYPFYCFFIGVLPFAAVNEILPLMYIVGVPIVFYIVARFDTPRKFDSGASK